MFSEVGNVLESASRRSTGGLGRGAREETSHEVASFLPNIFGGLSGHLLFLRHCRHWPRCSPDEQRSSRNLTLERWSRFILFGVTDPGSVALVSAHGGH